MCYFFNGAPAYIFLLLCSFMLLWCIYQQFLYQTEQAISFSNSPMSQAQSQADKPSQAIQVLGNYKWLIVLNDHGFTNGNDTKKSVFVHRSSLKRNNPRKILHNVEDGKTKVYDVMERDMGTVAANVIRTRGASKVQLLCSKRLSLHWFMAQPFPHSPHP